MSKCAHSTVFEVLKDESKVKLSNLRLGDFGEPIYMCDGCSEEFALPMGFIYNE